MTRVIKRSLICGLCPRITDFAIPYNVPHILVLHVVLDHRVPIEVMEGSRRYTTPSGRVGWRLPNGREWLIVSEETSFRL